MAGRARLCVWRRANAEKPPGKAALLALQEKEEKKEKKEKEKKEKKRQEAGSAAAGPSAPKPPAKEAVLGRPPKKATASSARNDAMTK